MIPVAFDYVRPSTVDEAVAALVAGGEDAKVMVGGQSLMPVLRLRLGAPSLIVDCSRIDEMIGIREEGDSIVIGAGTTHHAVMNNDLVKRYVTLLAQATATVADPQIRHRGTMGGSLAHADPAGDLPAVAAARDATLGSSCKFRTIALDEAGTNQDRQSNNRLLQFNFETAPF